MFKKPLIIITSLIPILIISFAMFHQTSSADILNTCGVETLKKYLSLEKGNEGDGYKELIKSFDTSDGYSREIKIRIAFEKAREEYHDTIRCVFDIATVQILGSASGIGDNLKKDDLPSLMNIFKDLNDAEKVCKLTETDKFKKMISDSVGFTTLVQPLLEAYDKYKFFIGFLRQEFVNMPIDNSNKDGFTENYLKMEQVFENEKTDSLAALETAFLTLKEMRIAFVMHVRFECILKNLELYQSMMRNIRSIVSRIPSVIEDASMHK